MKFNRLLSSSLARKVMAPLQRDRAVDPFLKLKLKRSVADFIAISNLSESALIIDGPGLGCSTGLMTLSLLGVNRLSQLNEIHAFSGAGYGVLFFYAHQEGYFRWNRKDIFGIHRESQLGHRAEPLRAVASNLIKKIKGEPYLYSGDLLESGLVLNVAESFHSRYVGELPPNLKLWTYNLTHKKLEAITAYSKFQDLKISQVMRAVASVPHLYEPFLFKGCEYIDAIFAPNLKGALREIRRKHQSVLFCHMFKDGRKGNTTYLKMHSDGNGYARVVVDFLYFINGRPNREFSEGLRAALFETRPLL